MAVRTPSRVASGDEAVSASSATAATRAHRPAALDPQRIWMLAEETLRSRIGEPAFATWLEAARLAGDAQSGEFRLQVPTTLARDWVTERHLDVVHEVLSDVAGREVEVLVEVHHQVEVIPRADDPEPSQLEIEVVAPARRHRLEGRGRFENNISRKAIWQLKPDRANPVGEFTTTDLIGKTTLTYTLGQLGPLEMDLMAWILGQWQRGTESIEFGLREIARAFGRSWKGEFGHDIKDALKRIRDHSITGRVWDAATRKHTTHIFGLLESVTIIEDRASEEGPALRAGTVTVTLSTWLVRQLSAGQYSDFEWDTYKRRMASARARRLYLFLESQDGEEEGKAFRVRIDAALGNSLGTQDGRTNLPRLRADLRRHGEEIAAVHPNYLDVSVKAGTRRGEYWLTVRRSGRWMEERVRNRRRELSGVA